MTYIENVFLCMASPLLIAALCMGKRQRKFFLFCFAGMGACLLSAYINTFFAALYKADTFAATTEIAPVVEEVMKLLPLLFYLLISDPKRSRSFFFYFLPGYWDRSHACDLWGHCRRWTCICVAENMAEDCRNLRSAGSSNHLSRNL